MPHTSPHHRHTYTIHIHIPYLHLHRRINVRECPVLEFPLVIMLLLAMMIRCFIHFDIFYFSTNTHYVTGYRNNITLKRKKKTILRIMYCGRCYTCFQDCGCVFFLCAAVNCGVPVIRNGSITRTTTTYLSVAHVICDAGYKLVGDSTTTCQANTLWSSHGTCNST